DLCGNVAWVRLRGVRDRRVRAEDRRLVRVDFPANGTGPRCPRTRDLGTGGHGGSGPSQRPMQPVPLDPIHRETTLGTRQLTFEHKQPLEGGKKEYESEAGPRIAEGATKYRVRVLRAKLSDGAIWKADEAPPPPTPVPPASEPPKP